MVAAVVLVLAAAAGGALRLRSHAAAASAQVSALQTAPVTKGDIVSTMEATGTVQAWGEAVVRVGVGVNGTLQPFTWNVSQRVHQGETLFTLVNPQLQQQADDDETSLRQGELALQQMQADAADPAARQTALAKAELAVQQAQYAHGQAQANLSSEERVVAPVSGTVATVPARRGQVVGNGAAVASILQTDQLFAQVDVAQDQIPGVVAGATALVMVNGVSVPGTVRSVGPTPATTFRGVPSYPATIALANPGGLRPGMPVTAAIERAAEPSVWVTGLTGTLAPSAEVDVPTQAAGTVTSVSVRAGEAVSAGQTLAEIRSPALEDAVVTAEQDLQQAEAALALLQAQQGADAMTARYGLQQQEIKVANLRDAVARDHVLEEGLVVRSPVGGVISGVEAVAGEPVGPGTPLLTIGDYSSLLVTFPLAQLYVNEVHVGQPATVSSTAAPGKTFAGSVYLLAPEGRDVNGVATFQAEVQIPGPTPELRPGMAVDVSIVLGRAAGVLTVPLQALHTANDGSAFVVVVRAGAATDVPVKVGLQDSLDAEVTGNLHAGMRVLTSSLGGANKVGRLNQRGRLVRRKPQVTHRAPANTRK